MFTDLKTINYGGDYEPELLSCNNYYPFGMMLPLRNYEQNGHRYGFNGMERDDEMRSCDVATGKGNSYTTHFRQYDPRLARWLSPDPKPNASESFYAGLGNNPNLYTDILGDTLDIADNKDSKDDINSLVLSSNQKYITFNKGRVELNFGSMSKSDINTLLKKDEGLNLINDCITSKKKFLYEALQYKLNKDASGNKTFGVLYKGPFGIINIGDKNSGLDSKNKLPEFPKDDYNGQIIIEPNRTFYESNGYGRTVVKSRASIVFHELAENYERVHNGIDYNGAHGSKGAHQLAIDRENKWSYKSNTPGGVIHVSAGIPPTSSESLNIQKEVKKYMGW